MRRRTLALVALLALVAAPSPGRTAPGQKKVGWGAPIAASLLSDTKSSRSIVLLRDRADLSIAEAIPDRAERRRAVYRALRSTAERSQRDVVATLTAGRAAGSVATFRSFWVSNAIAVETDLSILRMIARDPRVQSIVADDRVTIARSAPADLRAGIIAAASVQNVDAEWGVTRVGAPPAWALGIDGTGVVVGSLDTGVDDTHPAVSAKYRGADGNHDYDWWDTIGNQPEPYDDSSHGTHTTGTILGGDGQGPGADDIGVAPGATWIAAKAFDKYGSGYTSGILEAGQFLAAPTRIDGTMPRPELAPDVVNNSWGGSGCSTTFRQMVESWRAMDIFPSFSAGYSGPDPGSLSSPGDLPISFAVGATDINDEIATFSSRGPSCYGEVKPEVSAPGSSVRSSTPGGGYATYSGTSMAAPHVTGAVALVLQAAAGSPTTDQIETILAETSLDLGAPGHDNTFGAGRLRAYEAVQDALSGGALAGTITDAVDNVPIAGAEVRATRDGRSVRAFAGPGGSFSLRLTAGAWATTVSAFGFTPSSQSVTIVEGQTTQLSPALAPLPQVTLSGLVTQSPGGALLSGVEVRVLDTPLAPAITDAAGAYSIRLPAGTYTVEAVNGRCHSPQRATVAATADATANLQLPRILDALGYICDEVPYRSVKGTTRLALTGDDESVRVVLPFAFPFYGNNRAEAYIHTNGFVSFAPTAPNGFDTPIPSASEPNGAVYALWDDLLVRGSVRGVYTAVTGTQPNRAFVIEYRNVEVNATGDLVNFSVLLGEDGSIETHYTSLEGRGNGRQATIGIEDGTGTVALQYSSGLASLADQTAIRYQTGPVGFVTGTVSNAADGLGVAEATVSIGEAAAAVTGEGTYRIAALPGSVSVVAAAPGYGPVAPQTIQVAEGVVAQADFALPAPKAALSSVDLRFTARPGGASRSQNVTLSNSGTLPLSFQAQERRIRTTTLETIVTDPAGDSDGSPDLIRIDALADAGNATFAFVFAAKPLELGGYMPIDTDQNPATGIPAEHLSGRPEQDVGAEYYVDFFGALDGKIDLWDQNDTLVGTYAGTLSGSTLSFTIPLADLNDDGDMNVCAIVGDYSWATDCAPDAGHGELLAVADVPWLSATPAGGDVAPGTAQEITVTVDPGDLPAGRHRARLVLSSNDPRRPTLTLLVTLDLPALRLGINAGGGAVQDGSDERWEPDQGFLVLNDFGYVDPVPGGLLPGGASQVRTTQAVITGTADQALFKSQREGMKSYYVRVPSTGLYRVELGFAEITGAVPGDRVFDVVAEGRFGLLTDYDIAAVAGQNTADVYEFEVLAEGLWLEVEFVARSGLPVVNMLRVTSTV